MAEVMISVLVMAMVFGGAFATIILTRRLTEGSIYQNSTVTIIQGYMEQMKTMEFSELTVSPSSNVFLQLPTVQDQVTPDKLTLSWGSPPTTMPAIGTTPSNAVNNTKVFDINNTPTNANDDLTITIWVWVRDLDVDETDRADVTNIKSITMIYRWQVNDGNRNRTQTYQGSIRAMRSVVPSY